MADIFKQALAEQDLIDIWVYTFNKWGEAQANEYLDELDETIRLIAEQPLLCRERHEFDPPVRIHHHAHHLIVYLVLEKGIRIVRVLHESMEIDTQIEGPL